MPVSELSQKLFSIKFTILIYVSSTVQKFKSMKLGYTLKHESLKDEIFNTKQLKVVSNNILKAFKVPRTTVQMIMIHLNHCSTSSLLDESLPLQNLLEVCLFCQIAYFVSLFDKNFRLFVPNKN